MSTAAEFDWRLAHDDGDLAITHQAAIAVYQNSRGDLVIRQEGQYGPDEDQVVIVTPENAAELAKAIIKAAGPVARPDIDWNAVNADFDAMEARNGQSAGAERSRRYRQKKKRDASVTRDVTHRDARDVTTSPRLPQAIEYLTKETRLEPV